MDWNPKDLVTWEGAKLLSRPDMTIRKIKGIETPQRVGRAEFKVELNGEVRKINVGSNYWNAAVEQFADIQGELVDITFLPYPWEILGRSGVKHFFYEIKESK